MKVSYQSGFKPFTMTGKKLKVSDMFCKIREVKRAMS